MSQEKVLKTLRDLGLTRLDSKIYIYLAKKGPQKGKEISSALKVRKQQIYSSLKKLQSKAVVSATLEHPARFSAVPFENVVDLFIRAKLQEAQTIQHEKSKLLSSWQAMQTEATPESSARFMVIEGRNIVYSKIKQMINATQTQLSIVSTATGLVRADQFGLLTSRFKRPLRSKVQFRILTQLSKENVSIMQTLLKKIPKTKLGFEIRNPNVGSSLFPRMIIRDQEEVVFFINPKVDGLLQEQDNLCLWTNCKSLIDSFLAMFEELWRNSIEIEKKIAEIETGEPTPETFVISDVEALKKEYCTVIQSAREEITLLTSSKGLLGHWKNIAQFKNLTKKGVNVKIMAPIVKENWEAMEQLSKFCTIKHIPIHYWETTIIDGKHLFQFKTHKVELEQTSRFDNAFYTDDSKWIETMKTALNDIWNSAQTPSTTMLELITGPKGHPLFPLPKKDLRTKIFQKVIDFKPPGTITEKDVVNKIIHGKRFLVKDPSKDVQRSYGSNAFAVIHPPNQFNLPDMLIQVQKHDKKSSFGEGDDITVYLWLETQTGHAYIPVATIIDNPQVPHLRKYYAGTPAAKNYNFQQVKKDELQVIVHGNTMFAGWTVPIRLYPSQYVLPPACLLIEGYGDVRTTEFTLATPSGFRITQEDNSFDAFVTFIHPESKYSGPGTDGVLIRDCIQTIIPS